MILNILMLIVFLVLIVTSYPTLFWGAYRSIGESNPAHRYIYVAGFVLLLVSDTSALLPLVALALKLGTDSSFVLLWLFLLVINLFLTLAFTIYLLRNERNLFLFLLPQIFLSLFWILTIYLFSINGMGIQGIGAL
jgi:hypothetical protein